MHFVFYDNNFTMKRFLIVLPIETENSINCNATEGYISLSTLETITWFNRPIYTTSKQKKSKIIDRTFF